MFNLFNIKSGGDDGIRTHFQRSDLISYLQFRLYVITRKKIKKNINTQKRVKKKLNYTLAELAELEIIK